MVFMGRVQGVGFRFFFQNYAQKLDLTGTVRNLENGMVEAYITGEYAKIELLLKYIKNANPYIRIDDYRIKKIDYRQFDGFKVCY